MKFGLIAYKNCAFFTKIVDFWLHFASKTQFDVEKQTSLRLKFVW